MSYYCSHPACVPFMDCQLQLRCDANHAVARGRDAVAQQPVCTIATSLAIGQGRDRLEALRQAIVDCLLVLRTRDGLPITDDQARERANNILAALHGLGAIV